MRLIGLNFTKINIEKFSDKLENLKINTKIDVSDITTIKADMFKTKEEFIMVNYSFNVDYEPDIAKINISGKIVLALDPKISKEVLKKWKDKKVSDDIKIPLFNIIIRKSSLKALELEEDMNLPSHIPFPTVRSESDKNKE